MITRRRFALQTAGVAAASSMAAFPMPGWSKSSLRLRYCINIDTHFTEHPVLRRLELVAAAGFPGIEFNGLRRLERGADDAKPNLKAIAAYGEKLRELGLVQGVWVTNPCASACDCALTDPDQHEQFFRNLEETKAISPLVQGTVSTVTSGLNLPGEASAKTTARVVEVLRRAGEMLETSGPTLVLEPLNTLVNHPNYHVVLSEHANEIIEKVNHPRVKILYDIYHQQISEGNLILNIKKYYANIGYFQFGDHPGRHEPFTGEIHYPNVFRAIAELGFTGLVGGEYSPAGGKSDAASSASLNAIRRADPR